MADAPSPVASSAAQASFQAKAAADVRDAGRAAQSHAAVARVKTAVDESTTVETADSDVAVFANAEGSGSQGRQTETSPDENSGAPHESGDGISVDEQGRQYVDIRI